jgi:hypothetical protein
MITRQQLEQAAQRQPIGTDVNIAARLMGKAHGTVYLDPTTYRSLNKSSKELLKELDPIGLKDPMKPYEYVADYEKQVLPQLNEPDERLGSNLLIRKTIAEALSRHLDRLLSIYWWTASSCAGDGRLPPAAIWDSNRP